MTLEQFKSVEKYESALHSAKFSNFARMTSAEFQDLGRVYESMFNTKISRNQMSCGNCKLSILKRVADEFYKFKNSPYYKSLLKKEAENEGQ